MVQMFNSNRQDNDLEDLFEALRLLRESLQQKKAEEITDFAQDGETHVSKVNRLAAKIAAATTQINAHTDDLVLLQGLMDDLQRDLLN